MKKIIQLMILHSMGLGIFFDQTLAEELQKNVFHRIEEKPQEDLEEDEEDLSFLSSGIQTDQVLLRGLNKITAHTQDIIVPLGQKVKFGDLEITARLCQKSPPEESPEATAYLEVFEKKVEEVSSLIFSGWMFASTPAVSALEHPVYDIWILDCQGQIIHELPFLASKSTFFSGKTDSQSTNSDLKKSKISSIKTQNQSSVDIFNRAFEQKP